jgi:uncharacterized protein YodC (DUF2158 family)
MSFQKGDVVCFKCGGARMVVAAAEGDDVECVWHREDAMIMREVFDAVLLEKASDS